MGRRTRKRRRMTQEEQGEVARARPHNDVQDPALRLLAIHPTGYLLAVTVGQELKLADLSSAKLISLQGEQHTGALRVCEFDRTGKLLLTGGDDKVAKVWDTATGACLSTMSAPKKISAGVFSPDSQYAVFADKFGDVLAAKVGGAQEEPPSLLLSHFASFIMSLEVTPDQRYVISCDRDSKIRVSVFPSHLLKGSYQIESFCLGHSNFVTSSALLELEGHESLLLSAGGDGTVRLWRPSTGALLCMLQVGKERGPSNNMGGDYKQERDNTAGANGKGEEAGAAGRNSTAGTTADGEAVDEDEDEGDEQDQDGHDGGEDDEFVEIAQVSSLGVPPRDQSEYAPVLSIAVASDRHTVAVTVEGEQEVVILSFDPEALLLTESARVGFSDVSYPASVSFDREDRLWVVGGVPLQTSTALHLGVACKKGDEWVACTDTAISPDFRASLECRSEEEEKALQEGMTFEWYSEHLKKKAYTQEELQYRKCQRNDFKESVRLLALKQADAKTDATVGTKAGTEAEA